MTSVTEVSQQPNLERATRQNLAYDTLKIAEIQAALLRRTPDVKTATFAAGEAFSDAIDVRNTSFITAISPATGWTTASLGVYACDTEDGTFVELESDAQARIALTVAANKAIQLVQAAGQHYIKLWSHTAGVDEAQVAGCAWTLMLKG